MKAKYEFKDNAEWLEYLRFYYAGQAVCGLLANTEWMKEYKGDKYLMQDEVFSEVAIRRADALIKLLIPPPPKSK